MDIKISALIGLSAAFLPFTATVMAQAIPDSQTQSPWFTAAQQHVGSRAANSPNQQGSAKNVILFVGAGMGVSTLAAARILGGQQAGGSGEESTLSFEQFPHTALVKTYTVDAQIPDSAGTMTAMISGIKTNSGVVGIKSTARVGNCSQQAGNELATALDFAEIKGLATGIVTTARITNSTPAAVYAKSVNSAWEGISNQSADVISGGCEDIASQLVNFETNLETRFPNADVDGIDVIFGGGRRHFLPADTSQDLTTDFGQSAGSRTDGRNLVDEWQSNYLTGRYVFDEAGLDTLQSDQPGNVFGLFSDSHIQYEAERAASAGTQPSLSKMVVKAIEILDNDPDGFFLVVEAARIEHAHLAGNAHNALTETLELSTAVSRAQEITNSQETLIIVAADHGQVMTFAGSPRRGNPILGKVVYRNGVSPGLAGDGLPFTTLGYANGPGFRNYGSNTNPDIAFNDAPVGGRQNLESVNTQDPGFHQETLVPLVSQTHGGEDVSAHATGPGAYRLRGSIEQNVIFHVMDKALGLTQ